MATPTLKPRDKFITAGEAVPDFTLQDQERKDWKLSEIARRGDVVLCFFPFAFTGVCGTEMKCIRDEMASWKKKGAQVVGISCDSTFALKEWAAKEGFTQTLLSDIHRQVCKALGVYWSDMNVSGRGTVIVGHSMDGKLKVKWSQQREIKAAMKWDEVMAAVA